MNTPAVVLFLSLSELCYDKPTATPLTYSRIQYTPPKVHQHSSHVRHVRANNANNVNLLIPSPSADIPSDEATTMGRSILQSAQPSASEDTELSSSSQRDPSTMANSPNPTQSNTPVVAGPKSSAASRHIKELRNPVISRVVDSANSAILRSNFD